MPVYKLAALFGFFILGSSVAFATSYTVDIVATVPGCGDGVLQLGEECDGGNLGGASCETIGFDTGSLTCSSACTFLTTSCVIAPPGAPSGGGGTRIVSVGDSAPSPLPETNVVVSGLATPGMNVSLLKDGQKVATVPAKEDGSFQITISGLSGGSYRMQIVATSAGFGIARSEVFLVQVLKDATTKISEVVLPPSLVVGKAATDYSITGVSYPGSTVSLYLGDSLVNEIVSDQLGVFRFFVPVSSYTPGTEIYVTATLPGKFTIYRSIKTTLPSFEITSDFSPSTACSISGDINTDCRVDAVDFFVSRWQFVRDLFSERFDFNQDGVVDLVDFSIIAFNWTG